jgi:hypothetical protein
MGYHHRCTVMGHLFKRKALGIQSLRNEDLISWNSHLHCSLVGTGLLEQN